MKIVITDGYTLNPGDLSWRPFDQLGEVIYYDRTTAGEVVERCRPANVIITNKTTIDAQTIRAAADLKLIAVSATGYNVVDIGAARERGIPVCNVPEYGTDSVAQHAFALLLELASRVGQHERSVREGEWHQSADWCYGKAPLTELKGKILGLVGFGRIGQQMARIAQAFGMQVIYFSRSARSTLARAAPMDVLFAESDFISLHCPLTPDNHSFINAKYLSLMKPTAYLINTARGQLIQEADLADALRRGVLAGAALDVLSAEPPLPGHPLIGLANCLITPHIAWMSGEARRRLMQTTFENVQLALAGRPQHVVNG